MQKLALIAFFATACGAPPGPVRDDARLAAVHAYNEALIDVQRATGRVKAALHRRDAAETGAVRLPTSEACAALDRAGGEVDAAWLGLQKAYDEIAESVAARRPVEADGIAQRQRQARRQRDLDAAHRAAWQTRCAGVAPVAVVEPPPDDAPGRLCRALWRYGDLLNLVVPTGWARRPHAGLEIARRLSRHLTDELDVLLVLAHEDPGPPRVFSVDRGLPGLGGPAPYRAGHLPRWRRLEGVVLLDATRGLREAPTLYGLARIHANRLPIEGCSPQLGGHWGYADVAGQLGGGHLEPTVAGRWSFAGRRAGGGGDVVGYAPLELYLLGLADPAEVGAVRFLRESRAGARGEVKAEGVCTVDGQELVRRFGRRPRRDAPWRIGAVVVSSAPLDREAARRYRADLAALFAPGPDEDPDRLNFHEATGGRGRLSLIVPGARRAGCGKLR